MVKFEIIWESIKPKPKFSMIFNYLFVTSVWNNFVVLVGNLVKALQI